MGQQYEVVNNDWYTKGQPLNIQSNIEIFAPPLLAIKELLQGGTVEGGANADCLIKIYQDSQERKHLFIANSAETPADLHQMLNFGASEAETISSCNGVGIKTALSFFAPEEATKGKFVMATRGEHGMAYVTSPFTTSEPMNEYWETDDGYQWPLEVELGDNYRTCIDTVIENFDSYEQDLNAKNLEEYMGVIFGFRIKDYGLNLRIETEEETIEHVKVNLPEILNAVEELYERKNKDDVALTVHHEQHFSIEKTEKKDGKTYTAHLDIQANNGVVDKEEKGFWRRRTLTQGAWLVQDGVLQTYIGPKLFDLAPHNSMNGMYTFLDVSSQDGATLKYDTPQFDPSKTSMNARGGLYQSIKQYFGKAEPERVNAQDERYQDYNSIRASYKWNKESFTEKRMRAFMDKALSVYALQRNAVEGNMDRRYVRELYDKLGRVYDGAILRVTSHEKNYYTLPEEQKKQYEHQMMPNEKVELLIEYKKSPLEIKDVQQLLTYMEHAAEIGEELPPHCILCGPTITKEALEYLIKEAATKAPKNPITGEYEWSKSLPASISLRLYNDTTQLDIGEQETSYTKPLLKKIISQETFDYIQASSRAWDRESKERDTLNAGIQNGIIKRGDQLFGSKPIGYIFREQIIQAKEEQLAIKDKMFSNYPEEFDDYQPVFYVTLPSGNDVYLGKNDVLCNQDSTPLPEETLQEIAVQIKSLQQEYASLDTPEIIENTKNPNSPGGQLLKKINVFANTVEHSENKIKTNDLEK